jgi:nitroimidazol reductase NimA-like FMN-containing flavoprotein (pyridoxamine 5'-phosphate oxidase superfamily)
MSRDALAEPANAVRRRDREVEDEGWIKALLRRAPMGTLAMAHDGQPFVNSNLFAYDEAAGAIFMHSSPHGRTRALVAQEQRVCFSVSEMGRLLPAPTAKSMSVEYAGVVVFGRGEVLEDEDVARHGLELLLEKYFPHLQPGEDYRPITMEELGQTAVYRITIECWSGKKKEVEPDFPGAFYYPGGRL